MKKPLFIAFISVLFLIGLLILSCESAYIKGAKLYIAQNNFDKAREQLNKSVEEYPNDPTGYYWLGVIDGQEGKWDEMLKDFDMSLSIGDKFKKQIDGLKESYFNDFLTQGINRYNDAVNLLKDKDVDENEVKGILRHVIATQELALKISPESDRPAEILSRAFLLLGEQDKAKELFEKLLEENPNHKSALSVLGNMYFEDGINMDNNELLKKSVDYHERLIEIVPDSPRALRALALATYQLGDSVKALTIFEDAVEKNPNDVDLLLNYGKILYETGNKELAEGEFRKSLELSPDNKPALRSLARFYVVDVKDYQKGIEPLNKLLELEPDNPDIWELIGIAKANLGNREEAEKAFNKAEELRKATP